MILTRKQFIYDLVHTCAEVRQDLEGGCAKYLLDEPVYITITKEGFLNWSLVEKDDSDISYLVIFKDGQEFLEWSSGCSWEYMDELYKKYFDKVKKAGTCYE